MNEASFASWKEKAKEDREAKEVKAKTFLSCPPNPDPLTKPIWFENADSQRR